MVKRFKKGTVALAFLALFIVGAGTVFGVASVSGQFGEKVLITATGSGPVDMDPANAWDSASIDVLDQVVETLFAYNLSDPNLGLINRLATGSSWNSNATELTVTLRQGVTFHDGSAFNATVVKWNFDRLYGLIHDHTSQLGELYQVDGVDIIKNVTVVDTYTVKFILNFPYSPLRDLLTFSGSAMLSMMSTPEKALLDFGNSSNKLIGTGPFVFESYTTDDNVQLVAYDNYWGGRAKIDRIVFDINDDANARNQAMLNKEVTFLDDPLPDLLSQFEADPDLYLQDGPKSLVIQYIGMNNYHVNVTIREAAAYAFNYTYALEQVLEGQGTRLHGPIPEGMKHYNGSLPYPTTNLTRARQVLIDAGIAPAGAAAQINNDTYWTNLAATSPIATFNYTYNTDNQVRADMGQVLKDSMAKVGIDITLNGTTWEGYIYKLVEVPPYNRRQLEFYFIGWGPDFNDPDNYITPLYSNTSASNGAEVNDPWLQQKMNEAKLETNESQRAIIYSEIQNRIQNELYPWIYVYQGYNHDVWLKAMTGYQPNAMGKVYFYPCDVPASSSIPIAPSTIILFMVGAVTLLSVLEFRRYVRKHRA